MTTTLAWLGSVNVSRDKTSHSRVPGRSRVEKRRELRANCLDASADVRTLEALRRMGRFPRLAKECLSPEYGH